MARRGENIYKRKDGRWEGRYIKGRDAKGKARYGFIYAASYVEVKKRLQLLMAALPAEIPANRQNQSFDTVIDKWMQAMKEQIKESSYVKYECQIRNHIRPYLGSLPTEKLTTDVLEHFVYDYLQGERALAPKTSRDILSLVKMIFRWAIKQQYLIPGRPEQVQVKAVMTRAEVMTVEEQQKLEAYLYQAHDLIAESILLTMYTGIRVGELCALRWEDVDLERGILRIRSTLQRIPDLNKGYQEGKTKIIITAPKSGCSVRDIPIPAQIAERLEGYRPQDPRAFLLTGDARVPMEPRSMNNKLRYILESCGLPRLHFHVLRHTFATRCVEKNFDIKTLSEILGHSSVTITLNRYVHISLEQKRKNMDLLLP